MGLPKTLTLLTDGYNSGCRKVGNQLMLQLLQDTSYLNIIYRDEDIGFIYQLNVSSGCQELASPSDGLKALAQKLKTNDKVKQYHGDENGISIG